MPIGHHLVYFPPQVTLSQLLPDGTDTLHAPGDPFHRRLWAGGSLAITNSTGLSLDGRRAVCVETIRDVVVKGQEGEEKVLVRIERRMGTVDEGEEERSIRNRILEDDRCSPIIENRDLVFMREKTQEQVDLDKSNFEKAAPPNASFRQRIVPNKALLFRFSALTFNAHSIHLDKEYTQNVEGYRNLLVHGPLTLTLLLTVLRSHLAESKQVITDIQYRNIAPLYVDEALSICGRPKSSEDDAVWDVWIEGGNGGLAVRVYTYGSSLETGSPRFTSPGDFFTYLIFVGSIIMLTAGCILDSVVFTHALILAFVYTFAQDNRGKKASFYIIQIPVEFLPWAMLVLTLVISGWPAALSEGTGIVAAHLYDFLTRIYPTFGGGRNYIITPAFVQRFFTKYSVQGEYRTYGTAYRPASQTQSVPGEGWASSFQGPWSQRGQGRRLG
ncbi:hypothetical protein FE257_003387 [Aspergillus nanangensis]|uniref:Derlin n=1 Tax=Aspergillus nanangensis TaxID=2582783 RepID=A0AAD4GNJ3_ASPNN|nr:hypothetical protein FE257_003387 [Aspergillus nanangensis]